MKKRYCLAVCLALSFLLLVVGMNAAAQEKRELLPVLRLGNLPVVKYEESGKFQGQSLEVIEYLEKTRLSQGEDEKETQTFLNLLFVKEKLFGLVIVSRLIVDVYHVSNQTKICYQWVMEDTNDDGEIESVVFQEVETRRREGAIFKEHRIVDLDPMQNFFQRATQILKKRGMEAVPA